MIICIKIVILIIMALYRGADIYDDEDDALDDFDPTDSDDYQFNDFTKTYAYHNHGFSRS